MLLFGHLGITLGIFFVLAHLLPRSTPRMNTVFLAVGALLPDIIDKPLGKLIFASSLANGHTIGHTLLFSLLIALFGFWSYGKAGDFRVLSLAAGSFCHILEDRMWRNTHTFFWPLFGLEFPKGCPDCTGLEYFAKMLRKSFEFEFSGALSLETIGAAVVLLLIANSLRKRNSPGKR